jgi:hypothetical protein
MLGAAPNWAEVVTAVGSALAGATLLVAAATARLVLQQVGETQRDRHLQWVTEVSRRWDDDKLVGGRIAASRYTRTELAHKVERWLTNPGEDMAEMSMLLRIPNYFEDVALMVQAGNVDADLVWRTLRGPIEAAWDYWEPSIERLREDDPDSYTQFEWLAAVTRSLTREQRSA